MKVKDPLINNNLLINNKNSNLNMLNLDSDYENTLQEICEYNKHNDFNITNSEFNYLNIINTKIGLLNIK